MRITKKESDGGYELRENMRPEDAVFRLGEYEDMYDGLLLERKNVHDKINALKERGDTSSLQYKQLAARKFLLADLTGRFERHGIQK